MKKLILFALVVVSIIACKSNKNEQVVPEGQADSNLVMLQFKVIGLNDSIIADSIIKMQFKLHAIEKIYLNKDDSTLKVVINKSQIEPTEIYAEIKSRGVQIVKDLN